MNDTIQRIVRIFLTDEQLKYQPFIMQSTIIRELSFVAHHSIHHLSMVRLIMNYLHYDFNDEDQIGYAPSTMKDKQHIQLNEKDL